MVKSIYLLSKKLKVYSNLIDKIQKMYIDQSSKFQKAMAILILALANYLLDIVSARGSAHHVWNRR